MNVPILPLLALLLSPFLLPAQQECRVHEADLVPLIAATNPHFYDHRWNNDLKVETAKLDAYRTLVISQDGCIRLHTTFSLVVDMVAIPTLDNIFWKAEVHRMMHAVYQNSPDYKTFGPEFEKLFGEKLDLMGLNRTFNFPLNTRNFVCEVIFNPPKDARIRVEMVEYIFKETVVQPNH